MMEAKITSYPDSDLQYRVQVVKANNKTLVTPVKSFDPTKIDFSLNLNNSILNVNELYRGLTKQNILDGLGQNKTVVNRLNQNQQKFKNSEKEIQFCFLEFKDDSFPTKKEIEYMTDNAYVFSDITPIPMLSNFTKKITDVLTVKDKQRSIPSEPKFQNFKKYLIDSIETINQLNHKPIMGYVPDFRLYYADLVKLYFDNGINTFYFDAHLSNPITLQASLRAFMRELNKIGALEKSFIHMLNPSLGRGIKDNSLISAKDILGYGLGVDSLGEGHMRYPLHLDFIEQMKKNPDNRSRLFIKNKYGYLKTSDVKKICELYPKDSKIDIENFTDSITRNTKIEKTFNVEQLSLESKKIQIKIKESETILKYLEKKSDLKKDDLKILKLAKIQNNK